MQDETLPIQVNESTPYKKSLKKLSKKYRLIREDVKPLIQQLVAGDLPGERISGNKYSVYKVRVKNSDNNKGQSGGYRVVYYTIILNSVLLATIYSKSEQEDLVARKLKR